MVKARENVVTLAPLRDIRLAGTQAALPAGRMPEPGVPEALVQEREQAALDRGIEEGRCEAEAGFPARLDQARSQWEASAQAEALRQLGQLGANAQAQLAEKFKAVEQHLVVLATETAIKLVNGLPVEPTMVEAAVHEALALVEQNAEVTIFLNPDDLALLKEGGSKLVAAAPHARKLHFVIHPQVSRGGCLVETSHGMIDAQRETRIDLLRRAVSE
jgi:flagellar assembly protein FliH